MVKAFRQEVEDTLCEDDTTDESDRESEDVCETGTDEDFETRKLNHNSFFYKCLSCFALCSYPPAGGAQVLCKSYLV